MTRRLLLLLVGFYCCLSSGAQVFQNQAPALGIQAMNNNNLHGAGISTVDFDLDGDHDLTICLDQQIKTYRNDNGSPTLVEFGFQVDDNAKHALWIDVDNDGDLDMYFTQMFGVNKLYRNDNGEFVEITESCGLSLDAASTFGCAWGDYDHDGDLDLFECNYVYALQEEDPYVYSNHLYRNNGDGTFTDVTLEAQVSDGISLSFQCLWSDFDDDGWLDLYVINDLEHPNRLYHNNGDGTFVEMASQLGADVAMMDAMTASPGDYDNDGDVDLFITNTSIGECALLRNDGEGHFDNVSTEANVTLSMLTWGAAWFDYDLDRDLDLYVCENNYLSPQLPNPLLKNNGNGFFTNVAPSTFLFDYTDSYSAAVCDWNMDGAPDMAVNNYSPQNAGLWIHSGSDHRWVSVRLIGQVSNSFGVGSKVDIWSEGVLQSRRMYCGQNYLAQHPYELHFGLLNSTVVDSLRITWPSGHVDTFFNLPANQRHHLEEGASVNLQLSASSLLLCEGDTVTVVGEDGYDTYLWSTGSTEQSMEVTEATTVHLTVIDSLGLIYDAELEISEGQAALIAADVSHVQCAGGADGAIAMIESPSIAALDWFDEYDGFLLSGLSAGSYGVAVTSTDGCESVAFFEVMEPPMIEAAITIDDLTCQGANDGSINYMLSGGVAPYTVDLGGWSPLALPAGDHVLSVIDAHGCEATFNVQISEPDALNYSLDDVWCEGDQVYIEGSTSGGTPPYTWLWNTGDTNEDLTAAAGDEVYVIVSDVNGCYWESEMFACPLAAEQREHADLIVYPNPTSNALNILNGPLETSWVIFDNTSRSVRTGIGTQIDLSGLSAGNYFLLVNGTYVTRVLKY